MMTPTPQPVNGPVPGLEHGPVRGLEHGPVRGLVNGLDEVEAPAPPMQVERSPVPATASPERTSGVGDVLRRVQMESIHPLRLKILVEIERTGSISAAAEACAIGQPSASIHLRTLEAAIGQRLVVRTVRGSSLTPAGKIVASHAARVLATLDSMRFELDDLGSRDRGELTVAASLTPSVALLPPILRRFSDRHPGVDLKLRTVPSETVVREVARAGAAIGIAGEVASAEPVVRTQILIDELVGIAPVGLFGPERGPISREELARHSLLLGAEGSSTRLVTERCLQRADCQPARIWAFDSYEAIKQAVANGLGVSFVSKLLVDDELRRGELAPFRVSGVDRMSRPIHAVQPSVGELTPQGAAFMSLLIDASPVPFEDYGSMSSRST
jgi:LysR family transcriptional regulator, low CO2-responsive transcriptional regulator